MNNKPGVWLRRPLDDMPGLLQPVAHALLQAREEVNEPCFQMKLIQIKH